MTKEERKLSEEEIKNRLQEIIDELEDELLRVDELELLELEVIDDVVLVELITLVDDVDVEPTIEVVVSSLDEIAGSEVMLEVALLTGPEQAEINKAKRSDKCFFIIKR